MRARMGKHYERWQSLIIEDFDLSSDGKDINQIISILKILIDGKQLYFNFRREEDFLDEKELLNYRHYIPEYFIKNGEYKVIYKIDQTHFDSIGLLPVIDSTFDFLIELWNYFWSMCFFVPKETLDWEGFLYYSRKNTRDKNGLKLLDSFTDAVFLKGHDGDNLIINYLNDVYVQEQLLSVVAVTRQL